MNDWNVVHVINGEKMIREEFLNKYPKEIEKMALKVINIYAKNYGVEVELKDKLLESLIL